MVGELIGRDPLGNYVITNLADHMTDYLWLASLSGSCDVITGKVYYMVGLYTFSLEFCSDKTKLQLAPGNVDINTVRNIEMRGQEKI